MVTGWVSSRYLLRSTVVHGFCVPNGPCYGRRLVASRGGAMLTDCVDDRLVFPHGVVRLAACVLNWVSMVAAVSARWACHRHRLLLSMCVRWIPLTSGSNVSGCHPLFVRHFCVWCFLLRLLTLISYLAPLTVCMALYHGVLS
jgi:hypothetical protein